MAPLGEGVSGVGWPSMVWMCGAAHSAACHCYATVLRALWGRRSHAAGVSKRSLSSSMRCVSVQARLGARHHNPDR
eukprot:364747-Chlamydomonas_euryale.AAC.15